MIGYNALTDGRMARAERIAQAPSPGQKTFRIVWQTWEEKMLKRTGKWAVMVLAGLLVAGLVGFGVSYAQSPAPTRTPQAGCPSPQGGMGWRWGGSMVETLAEALGMTPEALTEALRGGQKIADLAKAKNLTIAQLVDKLIAARQAALQQAVEAGRITQEQMNTMLQQMREQMTRCLEEGTCTPGLGGVGCGRFGGQGCGSRWGSSGQSQPNRSGSFGGQRMRQAPAGRQA